MAASAANNEICLSSFPKRAAAAPRKYHKASTKRITPGFSQPPTQRTNGFQHSVSFKFNKNLKFRICSSTSPVALPPSEAAPSGGTPPPEKRPNAFMKFIRWVDTEFGDIEKVNKLVKSFEAYPTIGKLIVAGTVLGYQWLESNKEYFINLKKFSVKYRAYLLGIGILLAASAMISINRKGGTGTGAPSAAPSASGSPSAAPSAAGAPSAPHPVNFQDPKNV